MKYIQELDGARGYAVALVLLFHFGYFPAGWIGVQVFFVLSGYLITQILILDRDVPLPGYLGRFYWRRTLRIFPLYYTILLAYSGMYVALGEPNSFGSDWPWLFTYASNFARLREADLPTLVHTWSLALEEQFYLLWPLVVYILPHRRMKIVVPAVLILCPLARFAIYSMLEPHFGDLYAVRAVYSLPITQMDAFAFGAAIAVFGVAGRRCTRIAFFSSLVLLAVSGVAVLAVDHLAYRRAFIGSLGYQMFLPHYYQFVWGYTLINGVAAFMVACARTAWISPILSFGPAARLGRISYGVYLYHLPLLSAGLALFSVDSTLRRTLFFFAWLGCTWLVSVLSFKLLEAPFLRLKDSEFSAWKSSAEKSAARISGLNTPQR